MASTVEGGGPVTTYKDQLLDAGREFEGEYPYTLDTKGRLVFPAPFRDEFRDGLCVVPGLDGCLDVWTREGYGQRKRAAARLPGGSLEARKLRRMTMSVVTLEMDGQHRVTLPQKLRDDHRLEREVTVFGNIDHVEIWDRGVFADYMAAVRDSGTSFDTDFDL